MISTDLVIFRGMTCPMCTARVTQALCTVAGVQTVDVDWKTGIAHVKGDATMEPSFLYDLFVLALEERDTQPASCVRASTAHRRSCSGCCCKR